MVLNWRKSEFATLQSFRARRIRDARHCGARRRPSPRGLDQSADVGPVPGATQPSEAAAEVIEPHCRLTIDTGPRTRGRPQPPGFDTKCVPPVFHSR